MYNDFSNTKIRKNARDTNSMKLTCTIQNSEHGKAAYEILSERMKMSRLMMKRVRLYGNLFVNGRPARMKDPVASGDHMEAVFEDEHTQSIRKDNTIPIHYEDDWIIVCEKPAGLVTHPSWQHMDDSLIQRLSEHRLHPVMRLDRETSGLIVIAKNGHAHHVISSQQMDKEYLGIIHGKYDVPDGTICAPIGRADNSIMIRIVREDGHPSVTHYQTEKYLEDKDISLVRFVLETGRCHQIRVHSRSLGHPLIGDGLYGPTSDDYPDSSMKSYIMESKIGRQALHACRLSFYHPITNEYLQFTSEIPDDMKSLLEE
jgi:23S rRNA pseudouridine1911/1915/1917 synthase